MERKTILILDGPHKGQEVVVRYDESAPHFTREGSTYTIVGDHGWLMDEWRGVDAPRCRFGGPLDGLTLAELLARAEMRKRLLDLGFGDPIDNELDFYEVRDEIERRRDDGRPVA